MRPLWTRRWNQVQEILAGPVKAPKAALELDFALKSRVRCKESDRAMVICKTYKKLQKYAYVPKQAQWLALQRHERKCGVGA
jgi:hypothetical protein